MKFFAGTKSLLPLNGAGKFLAGVLAGLFLLCLWLFFAPSVLGGPTPAGTIIKNQTVATFFWAGRERTVSSNLVITKVTPLYGVEITPSGDIANPALEARTAPGGTVVFSYLLTNIGNATDSFWLDLPFIAGASSFEPHLRKIYIDENGNGILDPGESANVIRVDNVPAGGSVHLLVFVPVPPTSHAGDVCYLDLTATSMGDASKTDTDNVCRVIVEEGPVLNLWKKANVNEILPGSPIEFTLELANIGGAAAFGTTVVVDGANRSGILVTDKIPDFSPNLTRFASNSLHAHPAGTRLYSTDNGLTWTALAEPPANLITDIAFLFDDPLAQGQSAKVRFWVNTDAGHNGQAIRNLFNARYASQAGVVYDEKSNWVKVDVKVGQSPSDPNAPLPKMLVIGPINDPAAVGTEDRTGDGLITDNDDQTIDPGLPATVPNPTGIQVAGNTVKFINTIENLSSVSGTINVSLDPLTALPPGWIVRFFQADGITSLMDSNGDGLPDTGILGPGERKNIGVLVTIPNDEPAGDNNGQGFTAVVRASWAANPRIYNLTHNTIAQVIVIGELWDPFEKDSHAPPVLNPGEGITYVNTFGNVGPGVVFNAAIHDELTADLTNVRDITTGTITDITGTGQTITVTGSYSAATHIVTWQIPFVPAGFTGQVRFKADVAPGVADGTEITNVFTITSDANTQVRTSNRVANVVGGDRILTIEKTANIQKVSVGDPVLYSIEVANKGADPISNAKLKDLLPKGLRYLVGSAQRDGQPLATSVDASGRLLNWELGTLPPKSKTRITLVCIVTPDAPIGDSVNTATVSGVLPLGSRLGFSDSALIKVEEGVFTLDSVIIGKVFVDQNSNFIQDQGEPGVESVRLYLEDGTFVLTDREGKYHIDGVKPGMRVLRLDETTLPEGHALGVLDAQNAFNPASRFVELSYGTMHKANFRVLAKPQDEAAFGPELGIELLPISTCTEGHALQVMIDASGPVESSHYFDEQTGIITVLLPGVTASRNPVVLELPEGNAKSVRAHLDKTQNLAKVQIFLRQRSSGYPPYTVDAKDSGLVVTIGQYTSADADPEEFPVGASLQKEKMSARILRPFDGESFISRSAVTVEVGAATSSRFELFINGQAVPHDRIGKRTFNTRNGQALYEFVGVGLEKGTNTLRFEATEPGSGKAFSHEIAVYRADDPKEISVSAWPENLMADARTEPVITISLLDENRIPTAEGAVITATIDAGDILTPDLRPMEHGVQAAIRNGAATLRLSAASSAQIRTLTIRAGDFESKIPIHYSPYLRNWIVTGIASGIFSGAKSRQSDNEGGAREETTDFAGRTALFMKGRLPGDVSLTAAYDSEKDKDNTVAFQERDPMRYYPVFGDESRPQHEAASRDKLYLKLERATSYALYGDFRTGMDKTDLAAYDRAFTGAKTHIESPYLDLQGFYAKNDQAQVRTEMPGNGTSGYYNLPDVFLVENTEQVVIETRDRNFADRIIDSKSLVRHTDYNIDYERGKILFKKPVPSFDNDFNPVFIVIRYEVDARKGRDFATYGGRAAVHTKDRRLELGASHIREEGEPQDTSISALDASLEILPGLTLKSEYAQSKNVDDQSGEGHLVELKGALEKADFTFYYKDVDEKFENEGASGVTPGRRTAGLKGTFAVSDNLKFKDELYTETNTVDDSRQDTILHDFVYQHEKTEITLGGGFVSETRRPADQPEEKADSTLARAGASVAITQKTRASLFHQHAFGDWTSAQPTHTQAKLDYAATEATKYLFGVEGRQDQQGDYNASAFSGIESTFSESLSGFARYTLENASDGPRGRSGVGLDANHKLSPTLRLIASGEISRTVHVADGGETPHSWAAALGFEYRPLDEKSVSSGRFEVGDDDTSTTYLAELAGALRVRLDHTLFAKNTVQFAQKSDSENSWIANILLGWAYRPVLFDKFNLLSSLEFKYEDNLTVTDGSRFNRLIFSSEAHYQPMRRIMLETKYAFRQVMAGYAPNTFTDVKAARLRLNMTDWLFVTGGSRLLSQYDTATHTLGWGLGFGVNIIKDLQLVAGYNFAGFKDDDFSRAEHWKQGWYTGLHFKFDESLLGILGRIERKWGTGSRKDG